MRDLGGEDGRREDAVRPLEIGDTVRGVYHPRHRWYSKEGERRVVGMKLGVVIGHPAEGWAEVRWEDGVICRGMDGCYLRVSEEEAMAIRMVPFKDRTSGGEWE